MLLKSCFDRFASFFGLIFFCPVLFVVAILIKVKMPEGPVIFKQKRVGKAAKWQIQLEAGFLYLRNER